MTKAEINKKVLAHNILNLYKAICKLDPCKFYGWYYTDIVDYLIKDVAKIEWNVELAIMVKDKIERFDNPQDEMFKL